MNLLSRKRLDFAPARLAIAIIASTMHETRRDSSANACKHVRARVEAEVAEAKRWLRDAESEGLYTLKGCCRILSLSLGVEVKPETIVKQIENGWWELYITRSKGDGNVAIGGASDSRRSVRKADGRTRRVLRDTNGNRPRKRQA